MKTNKIMDSIRSNTPAEVNKQVDFCVAIANRIFDVMEERGMKQRDLARALGDDIITTTSSIHPYKLPEEQQAAMMVAEEMHR